MAGQGPTSDIPSIFGEEDSGSGRGAVRIASVAALGGLLFGYDSAVINGAVDAIQKHFEVNNASLGFAVASALLGAAAISMLATIVGFGGIWTAVSLALAAVVTVLQLQRGRGVATPR